MTEGYLKIPLEPDLGEGCGGEKKSEVIPCLVSLLESEFLPGCLRHRISSFMLYSDVYNYIYSIMI